MPWTLYRYILKDLLKLLVFTTVVLTVVISFAAAIKPMSEGLLSPGSMFRFIIYTVPTMVQFAVPFAGAFAGTIVFNRMVNDNEILACAAGGISYRVLLVPVILLGLSLMIGLFYMSNSVVPTFYQQAARMIRKDFMRLVVRQVKRQETVKFGDWLLYADDAFEHQNPPYLENSELQPQQMITLSGVALAKLGKQASNEPTKYQLHLEDLSTAGRADLLLFNDNDETWITLRLKDTIIYPNDTAKVRIEEGRVSPIRLPNPMKDDPSFKTLFELRELGEYPDRYQNVLKAKTRLAKVCAAEQLTGKLVNNLRKGQVTLIAQDTQYRITSPAVLTKQLSIQLRSRGQIPITVMVNQGAFERQLIASSGQILVTPTGPSQEPSIQIILQNVQIKTVGQTGPASENKKIELGPAFWPKPLTEPLLAQDWQALVSTASTSYPTNNVSASVRSLKYQVNKLGHKIIAQLNHRAAHALIGPLLLLLGTLLSMKKRGKMPLVVFFWSFLISVIATVTMLSGKAMTDDPNMWIPAGVMISWSGNLLIAALLVRIYCVIRKN
jgi:lipopolysaccharide export system permease protein